MYSVRTFSRVSISPIFLKAYDLTTCVSSYILVCCMLYASCSFGNEYTTFTLSKELMMHRNRLMQTAEEITLLYITQIFFNTSLGIYIGIYTQAELQKEHHFNKTSLLSFLLKVKKKNIILFNLFFFFSVA